MSFEIYWLVVPLVGIGLSAIAAALLWWTEPAHEHQATKCRILPRRHSADRQQP